MLDLIGKWLPCRAHHPVLPNRVFSRRAQVGRFVPGFPLSVLRRFSLCGSSLSLSAISGAWSPHSKIPFLADKALAGGCGCVERSRHSRRIHDGRFAGVRYCCGIKPSASNWRDHSAGASRSRAMLTPRGRRPSRGCPNSFEQWMGIGNRRERPPRAMP